MDAMIATMDCDHHMLAVDWSHPDDVVDRVALHVQRSGPPDLVLAWLRDVEISAGVIHAIDHPQRIVIVDLVA